MSFSLAEVSLTAVWLVALTVSFGVATGTASVVAWLTLAFVGLMPPLVLMVLAHSPARTIAAIIHDLETSTSP